MDHPQGTLDLLILRTLALGPQHGWATSERVQQLRRAKYYALSKKGREQLEMETNAWEKLTASMAQVLGTT
jgi:DNA-binding PadR family transcriptional regulator